MAPYGMLVAQDIRVLAKWAGLSSGSQLHMRGKQMIQKAKDDAAKGQAAQQETTPKMSQQESPQEALDEGALAELCFD